MACRALLEFTCLGSFSAILHLMQCPSATAASFSSSQITSTCSPHSKTIVLAVASVWSSPSTRCLCDLLSLPSGFAHEASSHRLACALALFPCLIVVRGTGHLSPHLEQAPPGQEGCHLIVAHPAPVEPFGVCEMPSSDVLNDRSRRVFSVQTQIAHWPSVPSLYAVAFEGDC